MIKTAIIGGGPAGAYCACCLTENGIHPTIFDPSHPREKPCGGVVTSLAQKKFPFLRQIPIEHSVKSSIRFISPSGKQICRRLSSELMVFSRLKLDQYLLNTALDKGAELIKEKVLALNRKRSLWQLKTQKNTYSVKILIGADGVNSLTRRKIIGPLSVKDKGLCIGYFVKGLEKEEITIKYSPNTRGYIWAIPRKHQTSLGIISHDISCFHRLKKELDFFIEEYYPDIEKINAWGAFTPNVKDNQTFCTPLAGSNWILIGDAAGHVDPVTGEGILYALLDAQLAAQAVHKNSPQLFDRFWREEFGKKLYIHTKLRKWRYKKSVLELYCKSLRFRSKIYY